MSEQKQNILTFSKGDIIFAQNSTPSETIYDIHYGSVVLYDSYGTDHEVKLAILKADEFFGEMDMIAGQPRSFTAVAAEEGTRVAVIDEKIFRNYFSTRPVKLFQIMQSLDCRIADQAKQYISFCRMIYQTYKKNSDDLNHINLKMQQVPTTDWVSHTRVVLGNGSALSKELTPGQILFEQGQIGTVMYEVEAGEIILTADIGEGQKAELATIKEGQCFGVSGIVNIRPRVATATAGEHGAVVKEISAEAFEGYFKENEAKVMEILRHMAMLLRDLNTGYAKLRSSAEAKKLQEMTPPTGLRAVLLKAAVVWQNIGF